jgi:hypothetical protein
LHEKDAKQIYGTASTYVIAVLVLLVSTLCATASDVVRLFTKPPFHGAAVVTPWIALGVLFQGLYLVGSIGLVINKRMGLYPFSTGLAALADEPLLRLLDVILGLFQSLGDVLGFGMGVIGQARRLADFPHVGDRLLGRDFLDDLIDVGPVPRERALYCAQGPTVDRELGTENWVR